MNISGSYTFDAPASRVWETLMSPEALAGCIPGCETLVPAGEDAYTAEVNVGVGIIQGKFNAKIALRDQKPHSSFRLVVEGTGPVGFANGEVLVTLDEQEGVTTVQVESDTQVGGMIARVGQRTIGTVGKGLMDRFFNCLGEAVR